MSRSNLQKLSTTNSKALHNQTQEINQLPKLDSSYSNIPLSHHGSNLPMKRDGSNQSRMTAGSDQNKLGTNNQNGNNNNGNNMYQNQNMIKQENKYIVDNLGMLQKSSLESQNDFSVTHKQSIRPPHFNQQSFEKIKDFQPEHREIFDKLIQKQLDLEKNLNSLKQEQNIYQRYKLTILKENIELVQRAKIKEDKIRAKVINSRSSSKQATARYGQSLSGNRSAALSDRSFTNQSPNLQMAYKPTRVFERVMKQYKLDENLISLNDHSNFHSEFVAQPERSFSVMNDSSQIQKGKISFINNPKVSGASTFYSSRKQNQINLSNPYNEYLTQDNRTKHNSNFSNSKSPFNSNFDKKYTSQTTRGTANQNSQVTITKDESILFTSSPPNQIFLNSQTSKHRNQKSFRPSTNEIRESQRDSFSKSFYNLENNYKKNLSMLIDSYRKSVIKNHTPTKQTQYNLKPNRQNFDLQQSVLKSSKANHFLTNLQQMERSKQQQQDQPLIQLYQKKSQSFIGSKIRPVSIPRGAQYYLKGLKFNMI
ncbi:UNKNOWN [Stylonychia lemnae]|uniref:Uncharacterized protein n=1 Tax=Stylonychia lemnae TaxID=5949 RepID=A0A078A905_STYLE|nr:UNKNOWN [Stylonychia lemnae]|eukprot:CDW77283.1 UNKNOWN [Stylonychia lemnae]